MFPWSSPPNFYRPQEQDNIPWNMGMSYFPRNVGRRGEVAFHGKLKKDGYERFWNRPQFFRKREE